MQISRLVIARGEAGKATSHELRDGQGKQDLTAVGIPKYTIVHEVTTANAADAPANPSEAHSASLTAATRPVGGSAHSYEVCKATH